MSTRIEIKQSIDRIPDWNEFRNLDFQQIQQGMLKPAFILDGRNSLPHSELKELGFEVYVIGKNA